MKPTPTYPITLSGKQHALLLRLGGAEWLRQQIANPPAAVPAECKFGPHQALPGAKLYAVRLNADLNARVKALGSARWVRSLLDHELKLQRRV